MRILGTALLWFTVFLVLKQQRYSNDAMQQAYKLVP
jgi:hypothetical protein